MSLRTIVYGSSQQEIKLIEDHLVEDQEIEVVYHSLNLPVAGDDVAKIQPDLVLVYGAASEWAYKIAGQIYTMFPNIVTIVMSDLTDESVARQVLNAGTSGFICPIPTDHNETCDAIKRIYSNSKSRIDLILEKSGAPRKAEMITVFGTKGGIGKTTLATNLAVSLAKQKLKVCILDFDMRFGDAHMFLGVEVKETVTDMLQEQRVPTIDTIRRFFVSHHSGVKLLGSPSSPEYASDISGEQLEPVINLLRAHYDYVIVDVSPEFSDINLLMLEMSNTVLFMTSLDIAALKNAKKSLLILDSLNLKGKVKLIVSREFKGDISLKDVEKVMGLKVEASIPDGYLDATKALNQGEPIVLFNEKSAISEAVDRFSYRISRKVELNRSDKTKKKSAFKFGGRK